jgi:hypothetical protein
MDLTKDIEALRDKAIDAIKALQKEISTKQELIDSQARLIKLYEKLLQHVLDSQDIAWEHKNLGHDWKDLMTMIRGILQHDKDNSRISN